MFQEKLVLKISKRLLALILLFWLRWIKIGAFVPMHDYSPSRLAKVYLSFLNILIIRKIIFMLILKLISLLKRHDRCIFIVCMYQSSEPKMKFGFGFFWIPSPKPKTHTKTPKIKKHSSTNQYNLNQSISTKRNKQVRCLLTSRQAAM